MALQAAKAFGPGAAYTREVNVIADGSSGATALPASSAAAAVSIESRVTPVVLYDGVCGLCDRYVQFLLRHDRRRSFRFAPLQGAFAARALGRHGPALATTLSTIVLLESPETPAERVRFRSDAVLAILVGLGGAWRFFALLRMVPRPVRDAVYALVARVRHRIFGKLGSCAIPPDAGPERFLD